MGFHNLVHAIAPFGLILRAGRFLADPVDENLAAACVYSHRFWSFLSGADLWLTEPQRAEALKVLRGEQLFDRGCTLAWSFMCSFQA